jgi:uncharacterized membrane protein YcaP (DUF421 family)
MPDWLDMFSLSAPVLEQLVRGTVTYLALLILMRLVGQREAGGLGLTDVLVVVLVADAASSGLTGSADSIGDGLLLACTILFWSVAVDALSYRWPRFSRLVKARPRPLIRDGEMNRRTMLRELMSEEEVISQLRLHGVENPKQVARAFMEPNGMISIVRREGEPDGPAQPNKPFFS